MPNDEVSVLSPPFGMAQASPPTENVTAVLCRNIDAAVNAMSPPFATFTLLLNGVLTLIVACFGILGNFRSICYLQNSQIGGRLNKTLTTLATWDILLLISAVGYYSIPRLVVGTPVSEVFTYTVTVFHCVAAASFTASALLVVAVVIQQYFAVSRPLLPRRISLVINSESKELRISAACYISIFCIILRLPTAFELKLSPCFDAIRGILTVEIKGTALRENRYYMKFYRVVSEFLFNSLGPVVMVFFSTLAIICQLRSAVRNQSRLIVRARGGNRTLVAAKETQITSILLMLGIKFLLTHALPIVLDLWESFWSYQGQIHLFLYLVDISNFLVVLNSATNFIVYIRNLNVNCGALGTVV